MEKDAFKELDKIRPLVIEKPRDIPATRNSDTLLYLTILKDYYKHMGKRCDQEDFLNDLNDLIRFAPNKSSISRVKRRIQNDDKIFEPSATVKEYRETRQSDFSEWATSRRGVSIALYVDTDGKKNTETYTRRTLFIARRKRVDRC